MAYTVEKNDVSLTIVNREDICDLHWMETKDFYDLENGLYVVERLTLDRLLKFVGYQTYDFAYPIDWARNYCKENGIAMSDMPQVVWSYDDNKLFGAPLWIYDVKRQLGEIVISMRESGEYEPYELRV